MLYHHVLSVTVTDHNGCANVVIFALTQPAVLNDSVVSITYPVCNSGTGSITVGLIGGVTPYTYTWVPNISTTASATGITSRTYTMTVKDNHGCSDPIVFTITQPYALRDSNVSSAKVNVSC